MNGVLVDDERLHETAFRAALKASGFALGRDDYYRFFAGRSDKDGFNAFLAQHTSSRFNVTKLQESKSKVYASEVDGKIEVFDDAIALVYHLKDLGYPVGLVTGSNSTEVDVLLDELRLHGIFDVVVTSDDVNEGKPSAEPFLQAATALGLQPSECVVIEDSPAGIASARRAGMRSIAVGNTHQTDDLRDADLVVSEICELTDELLLSH